MVGNITCGDVESGWNAINHEVRGHQSHPRITGVITLYITTKFSKTIFSSRSAVKVTASSLYNFLPPAVSSLRWGSPISCAAKFCTTFLTTRLNAYSVSTRTSICNDSFKKRHAKTEHRTGHRSGGDLLFAALTQVGELWGLKASAASSAPRAPPLKKTTDPTLEAHFEFIAVPKFVWACKRSLVITN